MTRLHEAARGALAREVRELMTPGVVSIPGDASLKQVQHALAAHRVHAILVVDRKTGTPTGWISAKGVLRASAEGTAHTAAQAVSEPIHSLSPSASCRQAIDLLLQPGVTHLLVAHEHSALGEGVISDLDVLRALG